MSQPAYGLAIHTTSPELGLAIGQGAEDARQQVWNLGRDVSNYLHTRLAEFLPPQTWTDLAFIAVANGPGGFTGTRLGVVTARILAQQLDVPLFPISTLSAVAWQSQRTGPIAVQMQAQRGDLFAAIYQSSPAGLETILPDTVMSAHDWEQALSHGTQGMKLIEAAGGFGSSVTAVLELARLAWASGQRPHWSKALPFYGQHPVTDVSR